MLKDKNLKQVRKNSELFDTSIEKLSNSSLENVCGGISRETRSVLNTISLGTMASGIVGSLSCSIAELYYHTKAKKAMKRGDKAKYEMYSKASKGLNIAAISCGGVGTCGFMLGEITMHLLKDDVTESYRTMVAEEDNIPAIK